MNGVLGISRPVRQDRTHEKTYGRVIPAELAGDRVAQTQIQRDGGGGRKRLEPRAGLLGARGQKVGKIARDPAAGSRQHEVEPLEPAVDRDEVQIRAARQDVVAQDPRQARGQRTRQRVTRSTDPAKAGGEVFRLGARQGREG